jgi:hemolysin III
VAAFGLIAPSVFEDELSRPWAILLWTFLLGAPLSLFEYLYHRYLLHSAVLPFLGSMHRAHSHHHSLTSVKAPVQPKEPAALVRVASDYPIEKEYQAESMMFPAYSISVFYGMFLVLLGLPLKLLFPQAPILISTFAAVTLCYGLYELWHAVMHLPEERVWGPLMRNRRIGGVVRYVYSFHLMHHLRPSCNLAVVGFWGFAIWDHLFRTHRRPKRLPLDGAEVSFSDISLRRPLWPIRVLDRLGAACFRASRRIESICARIFLRRHARRA